MTYQIQTSIELLLKMAPDAVNSFHPNHWQLMQDLEVRASNIFNMDIINAVDFFVDVAFLKQPYQIDKEYLRFLLSEKAQEIADCIRALGNIDLLDYQAMNIVANLPYFGINGGRSFNSAVVRLVRPDKFAIIDWRNLAVLSNANGFEGLIDPPVPFPQFTPEQILSRRGNIYYSQELYIYYNNVIRNIASSYGHKASEIDLALWTYSIQKKPFASKPLQNSIFDTIFIPSLIDRQELKSNHGNYVNHKVELYLSALMDLGYLSKCNIGKELSAIFRFIRNECMEFGKRKHKIMNRIARIIEALDRAIDLPKEENLLSKWRNWEDMVNPSSKNWNRLDLPTSMLLEGYMIFEDFIPIREYFEKLYIDGSFEPKESCI